MWNSRETFDRMDGHRDVSKTVCKWVICYRVYKRYDYIGTDFLDEYAHSEYTTSLKGVNAKTKANAAQGVPELIEIATGKEYRENTKVKHSRDAKFGWYKYTSRFALLVYKESGEVEGYNVFKVIMIVKYAMDRRGISFGRSYRWSRR